MLVRAARRKARHDAFRQLAPLPEPLFLPWLCPAQLRFLSQTRRAATIAKKPSNVEARRDRILTSASSGGSRRSLATAVAEQQASFEDYIPFEGLSSGHTQNPSTQHDWYGSKSLSDLRGFDPSAPLIVNYPPPETRTNKIRSHDGIAGDVADIHMTLEACLRVGRLERASALVRRLGQVYASDSKALLEAHNQYLRGAVTQIIRDRDEGALKAAQKWFEVEIRGRGVEPDATTYALLIKASLQTLQGPKAERTVRRYIDLASRSDHDNEVLNLPILSDAELFQVTRVSPL